MNNYARAHNHTACTCRPDVCFIASGVSLGWCCLRSAVCTYNDSLTHQCNCAMNGEDITVAGQQDLLLEKLNACVATVYTSAVITAKQVDLSLLSCECCCLMFALRASAVLDITSGLKKTCGWRVSSRGLGAPALRTLPTVARGRCSSVLVRRRFRG